MRIVNLAVLDRLASGADWFNPRQNKKKREMRRDYCLARLKYTDSQRIISRVLFVALECYAEKKKKVPVVPLKWRYQAYKLTSSSRIKEFLNQREWNNKKYKKIVAAQVSSGPKRFLSALFFFHEARFGRQSGEIIRSRQGWNAFLKALKFNPCE